MDKKTCLNIQIYSLKVCMNSVYICGSIYVVFNSCNPKKWDISRGREAYDIRLGTYLKKKEMRLFLGKMTV